MLAEHAQHGLLDGPRVAVNLQTLRPQGKCALKVDRRRLVEVINLLYSNGVIEVESEAGFSGPSRCGPRKRRRTRLIDTYELARVRRHHSGYGLYRAAAAIGEGGPILIVQMVVDTCHRMVVSRGVRSRPAIDRRECVRRIRLGGIRPQRQDS